MLSATRSNAEVRRRKTRRRREESWDTIVGFELAMRKTRKNNNNPNSERNATRPHAIRSGGTRKRRAGEAPYQSKPQLNRRSVVSLHAAVIAAIREIDHQADGEPNDQPRPVDPAEFVHHVAVKDDAHNRDKRHLWGAKWTRLIGIRAAENQDGDADDYESQKRPDVHHTSDIVDRNCASDDRSQQTHQNRVFVWRAKSWVDCCEEFARQEPVIGHRVKHARLPQQHNQHNAREPRKSTGGDQIRSFRKAAIEEGNRQRRFNVNFLPRHHSCENSGHEDVKNRTDTERRDDSDRQIPLRIFCFLRGCRNSVEADVGKKDVSRPGTNS